MAEGEGTHEGGKREETSRVASVEVARRRRGERRVKEALTLARSVPCP